MHRDDLSSTVDAMTLRCVIVDDSAVFVAAARRVLEHEGMAVVGAAGSGVEALRLIADIRPDVVLVDIELDGESGFDLVRQVARSAGAVPPMILISTHAADAFADLVAESPALGFVQKTTLSAAVIGRMLRDGGVWSRPEPEPGDR
jgi:DNA-binding NarL/FixJ family response regulator